MIIHRCVFMLTISMKTVSTDVSHSMERLELITCMQIELHPAETLLQIMLF